jgi:hypothetical protein
MLKTFEKSAACLSMNNPEPHLYYESNQHIVNFHGNIRFTPSRFCDVWNMWADSSSPNTYRWRPGLLAIQETVREAERRNMSVRAMGAAWSLSPAFVTGGFLLNIKPLNVIEVGLHAEHCDGQYLRSEQNSGQQKPNRLLVFAQCGASIAELNIEMETRGLALPTSGAANGQTIAGAISTGTHGAAWKFGAIHDAVVGLHLITQAGESYWIEPTSRPVVTRSFADILQAQLVRDDRLFSAVLVSFGAFGIIHAVLLRAEPLYLLEQHLVARHFDSVVPALVNVERNFTKLSLPEINGQISTDPPYHFEVVLNPFAFDVTEKHVLEKVHQTATYVRYMYKRMPPDLNEFSPTHHLLGPAPAKHTTSTDAFNILEALGELAPLYSRAGVADDVSTQIIEGILQPDNPATHRGTVLTPGGTFGATPVAGNGMSCEIGFSPNDIPKAIEIVVREIHAFPFSCLPSIRCVAPSSALLAPTCYAPYTCMMEIPAALSERTQAGYDRIWHALNEFKVPHTFHWGQCLRWGANPKLARAKLESVFGQRLTDWLEARKSLLSLHARQITFSNPLLIDCGLVE